MLTPYVITIFGSTGWAQLFLGLVLLCLTTNALKKDASDGSAATKNAAAVPKDFPTFQRQYLAVMGIVMLADWLQGPYIYDLYMESLSEAQYSSLFLSGFLSSAVFGTPVGVLVDTIGRKRGCVLYCVLEIVINLLEHATTFELLLLGRFLGGISTSLLGCAFESWMVSRHKAKGYPAHLLDETFTIVSVANGVLAVIGGVIGYVLVKPLGMGPIGPFRAAVALSAVAMLLVSSWEENYGEAEPASEAAPVATNRSKSAADDPDGGVLGTFVGGLRSMLSSMSAAAGAMAADPRLWMLGLVQAFFEGSMFGWVSQWVPALFHLKEEKEELPVGIIFSCLMLCISTGANLFAAAQSRGASVRMLMTLTLALSFSSMVLPFLVPYPPSFSLVLAAFCGFEAACGAFMPGMGVLRAEIIPARMQSTIMTAYRLPLNAVVVLVTQLGKTGVASSVTGVWKGWEAACAASAIFFALALALHLLGSSRGPPEEGKGDERPPKPRAAATAKPRAPSTKKRTSTPSSVSARPKASPARTARSPAPKASPAPGAPQGSGMRPASKRVRTPSRKVAKAD